MIIRTATHNDGKAITSLLDQLGYPGTEAFISDKIAAAEKDKNAKLFVAQEDQEVIAFISIYFIPQIALQGDIARISYLCVDSEQRGKGIGEQLEQLCEGVARERGCDRIEVHCHERRSDAHRFYEHKGYTDSPKYLIKKL